jgi:hypothetical protein
MPPKKPDPPIEDDDSDRTSDEDFNPEDGPAGADPEAEISSDEENAAPAPAKGRKKTARKRGKPDDDELDSGDEATIQERKKKRRKGDKQDEYVFSDDEGGDEGIVIKTRSQRLTE